MAKGGDRGLPRAEVVHGDADAEVVELGKRLGHGDVVSAECVLGDLEFERAGSDTEPVELCTHELGEVGLGELSR